MFSLLQNKFKHFLNIKKKQNKLIINMKKNLLSKNFHQWLLLLVCFVGTLPTWAEDYPKDGIIYDHCCPVKVGKSFFETVET